MKNKASEQELLPKTSLSDETEAEITTEVSEASKNVEHAEKIAAVHHWIDDVFSKEQQRLSNEGVSNPQIWVEGMACIDKALAEHPLETLEYLARVYGVCFPHSKEEHKVHIPLELIPYMQALEQNQQALWQALIQQGQQNQQLAISNFASAKDDEGKLLHPHFLLVKDNMFALLYSGVASDFESAYEKALWLNPQIRTQMIEKHSEQNLRHLADEADRAKAAGFSPQGKLGKEDYSQMTTREILERKFKELRG